VTELYSSDYNECLARATEEHETNARPALAENVENIADYDVIFLGFPNWYYSVPMAILTFIDNHDLSGRTIIPFCAHGTGGLAQSINHITAALPDDVTILEAFGVYRPNVAGSQDAVNDWLAGLDIDY
jgi:FMN-dependent NADH-azoreductase